MSLIESGHVTTNVATLHPSLEITLRLSALESSVDLRQWDLW